MKNIELQKKMHLYDVDSIPKGFDLYFSYRTCVIAFQANK